MVTKAKSTTKKATTVTKKNPTAKKTSVRTAKPVSNKVDYYPNRVPFLAVTAGVSLLMVLALLITL